MDIRHWKDLLARRLMFLLCVFVLSLLFCIVWGLYHKASPVLAAGSWQAILFSSDWHPSQGRFGLAGFITGTLWVTGLAVVVAVPLSLLTAIFLAEYCPVRLRDVIKPVMELLAGISPVVYGVWGVLVVVPLVRDHLMPFFSGRFSFFPFVSDNYTGFSALAGGLVLAVMVTPFMISLMEEVMRGIPFGVRESSLALGATSWQTTKKVILKKAAPGIVAAVILGLSRAIGETMAVLMVAGCALQGFPRSIFDTTYPLPALVANTYGEMMSVPLYGAAIMLAALILLIITVVFNMAAWGILLHLERKEA